MLSKQVIFLGAALQHGLTKMEPGPVTLHRQCHAVRERRCSASTMDPKASCKEPSTTHGASQERLKQKPRS